MEMDDDASIFTEKLHVGLVGYSYIERSWHSLEIYV